MLDFTDIPEEFRGLVGNYQINLLDVRRMKDTEVFQTDLKQVSKAVKYMDAPETLRDILTTDKTYRSMDKDAHDVLFAMANIEIPKEGREDDMGKEKKDVCKALLSWADEARQEGRKEGRKEGITCLISACKELGATWEIALNQVMDKFKIDRNQAEEYMKLYW